MQDIPGADFELLHIHVTPTKPGWTRIMVHFYMAGSKLPLSLKVFPKLVPAWFGHLQGLEITDGDNTFLIAQVSFLPFITFIRFRYPYHMPSLSHNSALTEQLLGYVLDSVLTTSKRRTPEIRHLTFVPIPSQTWSLIRRHGRQQIL